VGDVDQRLRELEQQVVELSNDLRVLRSLVAQDHASALNKIRYVTEKVLHALCARDGVSWGTKEPTLENMIGPLVAARAMPKNIAVHVRTIQSNASPGSHFQEDALSATHVQVAQMALLELLEWHYQGAKASSSSLPAAPPAALPVARVRRRVAIAGGLLGAAGVAGVVVFVVASRGETHALVAPAAGLAAIDRYEHPHGEADDLGSTPMWQTAADDFDRAAAQPDAPARWGAGARFARSMVALSRGELAGATAELRAAIAADPSWAAPHGALADVLSRDDKLDEATAAANEAQRLEPASWVWVAAGARALRAANRLDDAIREYRRALTLARDQPALMADLALVYHASHLDADAERLARRALELDADLVAPHVVLAERALEAGDGRTALAEAQRVLAARPDSVAALLDAGDAEVLLGDSAAARAAYQKAIAAWHRHKSKGAAEARLVKVEEWLDKDAKAAGAANAAAAERELAEARLRAAEERSRAEASRMEIEKQGYPAKRQAAEKAKADERSRAPNLHPSKECLENPLAKGC
jgi:tetratricopeptide (TPR) repeat protein